MDKFEVEALAQNLAFGRIRIVNYDPTKWDSKRVLAVLNHSAPKVEQKPYGWVIDRSGSIFQTQAIAEDRISKWRRGSGPIALYTNPAPSGDELLDRIHSWLVCAPMVSDVTEYHEMAAQFVEEIAKQKGPQS